MLILSESDIFEAIFAIPQEVIHADLDSIDSKIEEVRQCERDYLKLPPDQITAEAVACSYHRRLLQGKAAWNSSKLSPDLLLYTKTLPAHQIAELACTMACESGRLLELRKRMLSLERELGLENDEIWNQGDGPQEYQEAADEGDQLLEDIAETVFLQVLKRYRCDEVIEMIEKNRASYEIRYEVGRRLLHPDIAEDQEASDLAAESIRKRYGNKAYCKLQERLQKAGF